MTTNDESQIYHSHLYFCWTNGTRRFMPIAPSALGLSTLIMTISLNMPLRIILMLLRQSHIQTLQLFYISNF